MTIHNCFATIFFLHPLLSLGGIPVSVLEDLGDMIEASPTTGQATLILAIVIPLSLFFFSVLFAFMILTVVFCAVERILGSLVTILSVGSVMKTDFAWAYETFIHDVEMITGPLWQRSTIVLHCQRSKCVCDDGGHICTKGRCFELRSYFVAKRLQIKCSCFRRHYDRWIRLSSSATSSLILDQEELITEMRCPLRDSSLHRLEKLGCGVFDMSLIEPAYDRHQLMWTEVKLKTRPTNTNPSSRTNEMEISLSKNPPGETMVVNLDKTVHELGDLSILKYSFWKGAFISGDGENMVLIHIRVAKAIATIIFVVLEGMKAFFGTRDASVVLRSAFLLTVFFASLRAIPDQFSIEKLGGLHGEAGKMLSIMAVSAGKWLELFSDTAKSWTRYNCYGTESLGSITFLQNLLFNRSVVFEQPSSATGNELSMLCLSRCGNTFRVARIAVLTVRKLEAKEWGLIPRGPRKEDFVSSKRKLCLWDIN